MRIKTSLTTAALALVMSQPAWSAGTVSLRFDADGPSVSLSTSGTDDYLTGSLRFINVSNQSFIAYCVELAQDHAMFGDGFQTYSVGSFSGTQASALQGLFSSSYSGLSGATQQAAFQTAIWEITHESSASFNATKGNGSFYFDGLTGGSASDNSAFTALVNGYLSAASSYSGPSLYTISKLSNPNFQDLVTATAVPEPRSSALLLGGLAMVGWLAGRRRRT